MAYHAPMYQGPRYTIESGDWLRLWIPAAKLNIRLDIVRANQVTELALVRNDAGALWWTTFSELRRRWSPGNRAYYARSNED